MRENLIEVRNLRFAYRDKPVLKGISFDVATGDTLSILGANGSGKSTLLRIMLGFLKFEGEVLIAGKSVRDYGKKGARLTRRLRAADARAVVRLQRL